MPKFVIERTIPGIAEWSEAQVREASLKSIEALADLGPDIQWIHSFVTDDKITHLNLPTSLETIGNTAYIVSLAGEISTIGLRRHCRHP
jgi:hypothetical protein